MGYTQMRVTGYLHIHADRSTWCPVEEGKGYCSAVENGRRKEEKILLRAIPAKIDR